MNRWLMILLALGVSTSCMKKLSETDSDGPTVSAEQVQQSLVDAWGDVDPLTIRKNEFVYLETAQKIQDNPATTIFQDGITVTDRQETSADVTYTLVHQTNDLTAGDSKLSTTEQQISISKQTQQALRNLQMVAQAAKGGGTAVHQMALGVQTVQSLLLACVKDTDWDVQCHNLTYSEELQPAPELVKEQTNCAGLQDCQIHVRKVSFDLVVNVKTDANTSEKQKVQYSLVISPDVPYLSRLMSYCYRGLVNVPSIGQKVLVGVCNDVKNFKAGDN